VKISRGGGPYLSSVGPRHPDVWIQRFAFVMIGILLAGIVASIGLAYWDRLGHHLPIGVVIAPFVVGTIAILCLPVVAGVALLAWTLRQRHLAKQGAAPPAT